MFVVVLLYIAVVSYHFITIVTVIIVQLGFHHCSAVLLCKPDQGDHKPGKPGFLRAWNSLGILCNLTNEQNSFISIKYLLNTIRSWASNEQSLVNFGNDHGALLTCYIAGVVVE